MAELMRVPEVAAGATEVVLSDWLVEVGDTFVAGDALVVIETEKAVLEVEADQDATLLKTLVPAGSQVDVGAPMALLGAANERVADQDALLAELGVAPTSSRLAASRREVPESGAESLAPGKAPAPQTVRETTHVQGVASGSSEVRRFVSPIARRLLREAGLSFDTIQGTGPNGRVGRVDVERAIQQSKSQSSPSAPTPIAPVPRTAGGTYEDVPHSRIRRAIATRLTLSKRDIPHFYVKRSAVLDDLLALRAQLNDHSPTKLSVNDFILRAVAVAHTQVPDANVIWTDEAMRRFTGVDIAVAVNGERGLVTPVLRSVETLSLSAISTAVKGSVDEANTGKLSQASLEGGSICVTNLGMYGVDEFSAIINPPQSAILAVGAGQPAARAIAGEVRAVTVCSLVLSVDHRAIDGALAAQWMEALVGALENPLRLVV